MSCHGDARRSFGPIQQFLTACLLRSRGHTAAQKIEISGAAAQAKIARSTKPADTLSSWVAEFAGMGLRLLVLAHSRKLPEMVESNSANPRTHTLRLGEAN